MKTNKTRSQLLRWFQKGLVAINAESILSKALINTGDTLLVSGNEVRTRRSVYVLSIGKAALPMVQAAFSILGEFKAEGLIVTSNAGEKDSFGGSRVIEAGHPVPDERSDAASEAVHKFLSLVPEDCLLLVLLSGGTSALLSSPLEGLGLGDLIEATNWLLGSGLDIHDQNTVRKHLSKSTGGRLCQARGKGETVVLAISDVIGDSPSIIGSGPFSPDLTSVRDAYRIVSASDVKRKFPERCLRFLESTLEVSDENRRPGSCFFDSVQFEVIARNRDVLEAIAKEARREGKMVLVAQTPLRGESMEAGKRLAALGRGVNKPCVWVFGGETTVTLDKSSGSGGRNQELALAASRYLNGGSESYLLAAGTDGVDGPTDATGAIVNEKTWEAIRSVGRDPEVDLVGHNSYYALSSVDSLIKIGPTGTNAMDVVILAFGSVEVD